MTDARETEDPQRSPQPTPAPGPAAHTPSPRAHAPASASAIPPGNRWVIKPAFALSVVCLLMALHSFVFGVLAENPRPGAPFTSLAFLSMALVFFGQARSILGRPWARTAMVVGATATTFFAYLWLSEVAPAMR
jgi:hypothetical protein